MNALCRAHFTRPYRHYPTDFAGLFAPQRNQVSGPVIANKLGSWGRRGGVPYPRLNRHGRCSTRNPSRGSKHVYILSPIRGEHMDVPFRPFIPARILFQLLLLTILLIVVGSTAALAQTTASIKGTVTDSSGSAVAGVKIIVKSQGLGIERTTQSNSSGDYEVPGLRPGTYSVEVQMQDFSSEIAKSLTLQVSQNSVQNFGLKVASSDTVVIVESTQPIIDSTSITVGQVIDKNVVQEIPLNGRHFVDLALLVPGTVSPPQSGYLTSPLRGLGSIAFNSAGGREDAINFMVNGINLSDMVQNQVTFQPTINTVSEFKIDNSTYSAEFGRNSGSIVNIATRSGSDQYHGDAYDYFRDNYLDARNFFNPTSGPQSALKRNQFGGDVGAPILKGKTFFFLSYEGLRQHQGLTTTSAVLTDEIGRAHV